jgi:hypothetical protein
MKFQINSENKNIIFFIDINTTTDRCFSNTQNCQRYIKKSLVETVNGILKIFVNYLVTIIKENRY